MDTQTLISTLLGIVIAGVGWWVNSLWDMIKKQQDQITQLNIKLAENYAPRVELQATFERIFEKLDEILTREIERAKGNTS